MLRTPYPAIAGYSLANDTPVSTHEFVLRTSYPAIAGYSLANDTPLSTHEFVLRALYPAIGGYSFVNDARKTNVCFAAACFSFAIIIIAYQWKN